VLSAGRLRYLEALPSVEGGQRQRPQGTLILLHAFPLNARMWERQLVLAEAGWRVIAPQFRGFDGGDRDPDGSSVDDYAGDVIDLLDALHIKEAVIGGVSMGGYVTFALFRHAPQYFRAMILADTRPQADAPEAAEGRRKMLSSLRANGVRAVVDEMLPKLLGETTRSTRPEVAEEVKALALANSERAVAGAISVLMTRPDSTPVLSSIHCPALILVGEEDTLTVPQISRDMHGAIPGSELVVVPKAGHLPNLERPDFFNDAVGAFLRNRV
jgi:pimeloyl-ACP methyl ester carboxylesterase